MIIAGTSTMSLDFTSSVEEGGGQTPHHTIPLSVGTPNRLGPTNVNSDYARLCGSMRGTQVLNGPRLYFSSKHVKVNSKCSSGNPGSVAKGSPN